MALKRNSLVLFTVAAVGYCYGAAIPEDCDGFETINGVTVCKKQISSYTNHQENINSILNNNTGFFEVYNKHGMLDSETDDLEMSGDTNNCKAHTQTIVPYVLKFQNTTYYVAQSNTFKQQIRITRCLKLSSICFINIFGYNARKTSCQEKTAATSLFLYDPENKKIVFKSVNIPVACSCMMSSDSGFNYLD